ncbi:hypothetical protein [Heyndrickxia ginsengihumi]|uniref:hypothetical protein n=1 Tax=Heyndrickxia ginsengihumi TaxID=363870 RepID=UPI00203EE16B|nr:hypothetical protein [Heyndrickxia ginsengihumi]MCM3024584.1 hypothetical protein [Heyndrickxia ginsengihumi]
MTYIAPVDDYQYKQYQIYDQLSKYADGLQPTVQPLKVKNHDTLQRNFQYLPPQDRDITISQLNERPLIKETGKGRYIDLYV